MTAEARSVTPNRSEAESNTAPRPIKVLIVDTAIAFGGTLVVARNLLKHLNPNLIDASLASACADGFVSAGFAGNATVRMLGPRVDYVTLSNWKSAIHKRIVWAPLRRGLEVITMAAELLANLPYLVRLVLLYRKLRLDVVHLNNYTMEPFWAARFLGIPIIYHLHGFTSPRLDGSGRRNFQHVQAFVSISRAVTESAVRTGVDLARIHEIPNFVEHTPEGLPPPLPATPAIGIFGRVTRWKGQLEFLRAAILLLAKYPELRVYIVGDASDGDPKYLEECLALALSSPYAARIEFTGLVTDVATYYRKCTVVVHASTWPEPFGMVLIEAMAEARPVVASTFGAACEIIQDGVEGYLVDPNDARLMVARIAQLLADPRLATEMGRKGYAKVCTQYVPDTAAKEFEQLYINVARIKFASE